jgi:hypothetical protein
MHKAEERNMLASRLEVPLIMKIETGRLGGGAFIRSSLVSIFRGRGDVRKEKKCLI